MSVCSLVGLEPSVDKMSTDELRAEYMQLKSVHFNLTHKKTALDQRCDLLREESVRLQQMAEVEEEFTANQLLRRVDATEKEVRQMKQQIEDEKAVRADLRNQIRDVKQKQTEVENQLEEREEYLLLTIQRKLFAMVEKKVALERQVMEERERYLSLLSQQLAKVRSLLPEESASFVMGSSISSSSGKEPPVPHSASTHQAVVRVEEQLNKLLQDHAEIVKESGKNEAKCEELTQKLKNINEAVFLDRARATKLRDDLKDARVRLSEVTTARDTSSVDDSTSQGAITPNPSLDISVTSLRDRTKEVLSSAPRPS